jgi:hypothetical protein
MTANPLIGSDRAVPLCVRFCEPRKSPFVLSFTANATVLDAKRALGPRTHCTSDQISLLYRDSLLPDDAPLARISAHMPRSVSIQVKLVQARTTDDVIVLIENDAVRLHVPHDASVGDAIRKLHTQVRPGTATIRLSFDGMFLRDAEKLPSLTNGYLTAETQLAPLKSLKRPVTFLTGEVHDDTTSE